MEIVVEYVLLQNFIIDFLIFKTTAKVLKIKCRFIFLASILGSFVALVLPIFNLSTYAEFILKILLAIVLVSITFSYSKFLTFLKIYFTFFFCTFLYGGVSYFFIQAFGQLHTLIVLIIVIITYLIFNFLLRSINRRKAIENFCFEVKLENEGKEWSFKGFLDTGNLLFDPVTQRPVSLVSYKVFQKLFDVDLAEILANKFDKSDIKLAHFIPLGTVTNSGKVLAFEIDKIVVGDKEVEKPILALCLKNFKNYEMILNNSFA